MSTNIVTNKLDKGMCIKWGTTVLICGIIALLPVNAQFTAVIKLFAVISLFAVLCFAFELMEITIIALLLPMLYWGFQIAPLGVVFQPWTQSTVWLMFGGVILGACFDQSGVFKRLTFWFMTKTGGSFKALIYGLAIFAVFGAYSGMGAPTVLYFVLIYGFCRALNLKPGSDTGAVLFYASYIAGGAIGVMLAYDPMFDIGMNMSKTVLAEFMDVSVFNVTYYTYAFHNLVFIPLCFVLIWLGTKILKPDLNIGSKTFFREKYAELGKMTLVEKKSIGGGIFLFILFVTQKFTGFDVALCMMLASIYCFLPVVGYCDRKVLKEINYSVPLFVAGTMAIGTVGNSIGAGQLLASAFIPYLGVNTFSNAFAIYLIGYVLNLVLTPMAVLAVSSGPIALAVYELGLNPIPVMYTLVLGSNNVLFPYEGAYYMLMFSYGYMNIKQFAKLFTAKAIVTLLWILLFAVPYWMMLGLYHLPS